MTAVEIGSAQGCSGDKCKELRASRFFESARSDGMMA